MIIDMICDLCYDTRMVDTKEFMESLDFYGEELGRPDFVMIARLGIIVSDWKKFKRGMIQYMDEYGYEGSPVYKKFKRMSGREIGLKFKK